MLLGLDSSVLVRAACLLACGAVVGLVTNAARRAPLALTGFEAQVACSAAAEGRAPPLELAAAEASSMCGRDGIFFADSRSAERFAEGHIAGAIHLPCDAQPSGADGVIERLAPARTIVVYGDSTEEARTVAETLQSRGLRADIRVLRGGFAAWDAEGLACASGPCRDCTLAGSAEPHR
jgi:rhodanese-related sulfurtransferase